jgi:voltage-gated potassium channel Kch
VIVLSPEGDDPDSQVIKSVLALVNDPNRRKAPYQIAVEIRDGANVDVARAVGGDEMQLVLADDLISRIVVHSSRQSGLSGVYSELLDFDGCEIYTADQPEVAGKAFGDIIAAYDTSTPIGICDPAGKIILNPPADHMISLKDRLVIISDDDASIRLSGRTPVVDESAILQPVSRIQAPERTLILGWNRRGPIITHELSRYVAPGSLLVIAADTPELREDEGQKLVLAGSNLNVEVRLIDTSNRANLDGLDIPSFDHVLVLGYSDHFAPQPADTRTLITLLHIRKIAELAGRHISVVSEMIDVRNRELAEVTRADDFVVSNKLVSLMLAQASENRSMAAIFNELLDEAGSEIYMRPAGDYVTLGKPVNFHTVTESARRRHEIALGHRMVRPGASDPRNLGGVVINPEKSEMQTYQENDRIIVLAED